jgi:hypothetical protein
MSKFLKSAKMAAVGVALATMAGSANAVTVNWGNHDAIEAGGVLYFGPGPYSFQDEYLFSLSSTVGSVASAVSLEFIVGRNISNGLVELFASDGDSDYSAGDDGPALGSFSFDSISNGGSFAGLVAGNYYYKVTGIISGNLGGSYLIDSAVSPVPVPPALLLMLSGLGVAALARRRKKAASAV